MKNVLTAVGILIFLILSKHSFAQDTMALNSAQVKDLIQQAKAQKSIVNLAALDNRLDARSGIVYQSRQIERVKMPRPERMIAENPSTNTIVPIEIPIGKQPIDGKKN